MDQIIIKVDDSDIFDKDDKDEHNKINKPELKLFVDQNDIFDVQNYDYKNLSKLFVDIIPVSWNEVLDTAKAELKDAGSVLTRLIEKNGHNLVPHPWNVFRSLALTPPAMVKVVIIGQDPYYITHGPTPAATGLCFECADGCPIERSLSNIMLVLKLTIPGFKIPANGELTKWAEQGVLLLNAALTTNAGTANAHADVWQFFPKKVLEYLAKTRKNIVYMLWGRFAQRFGDNIDRSDNLILEASHPTARGTGNTFLSCDHFNQANNYLSRYNIEPIDWKL